MAHVVLLRGVNVGGHRTFRPTVLAKQLRHLDIVNIGAAGTFVVRKQVGVAQLRAEFARRLPFETEIMICRAREIATLASREFFAEHPVRTDITRFVSVMARTTPSAPAAPMTLPPSGRWVVKILAREGRYVIGLYRREMQAIRVLGTLDSVFGVPLTTRNWNTIASIVKALGENS
jgi:uncharacterized protein (DUF1697 family)